MAPPRFALDTMLGRLATWLRLIGCDASYGSHLSQRTLVRHARAEDRIVLTRSRALLRERDVRLLFIESDHFRDQLRQVVSAFGLLPLRELFTRCPRCNAALQAVSKAAVESRVPAYVYASQEHFVACPACRRVYWPATHCARVSRELGGMGLGGTTNL